MRKFLKIAKWTGVAAAVAYGGLCLTLFFVQRSLVFPQLAMHTSAAAAGFPQAQEVSIPTSDGERLIAWYVAPRGDKPVYLYFHGNGDTLNWRVDRDRELIADGSGLLALSYRGYEGSTGSPSETGLHLDADAAYTFVTARVAPERVIVWGHSLGTGVAVRLAAEHRVGALVLEAPYTSVADIAAMNYPYVPVRLLLSDPFHSDERIGQVTAPVLILHGEQDDTIPISYGERLYDLVQAPKQFVRYPEGGHVNLDDFGATEAVRRFVTGLAPAKPAGIDISGL